MKSKRFQLTRRDLESWGKTALLFIAPVAILYFTFVIEQINVDGFQPKDFIPNVLVQGAMIVYVLNEILAFFKKWIGESKY